MKKVLIISPFFPPINAADMHRVRQSISYYKENGWSAEVVIVDPNLVEGFKDEILLKTLPDDIIIHKVSALKASLTRKFGLGSIAYRSMYFYWKFVNSLLEKSKYDLIFFSTTAFPICALGRIWKNKFNVPYIIDMQDPWRSDHYLSLPKNQRPPKFWLSYKLDSWLEKFSMKKVDGLMSVNEEYVNTLRGRYIELKDVPSKVIPFAAFKKDIEIAETISIENRFFKAKTNGINIVYIGRGGKDMVISNTIFLKAIKRGVELHNEFENLKVYFIGTSYNPNGVGEETILPIAKDIGIESKVVEFTQRIPYFESLKVLSESTILFVPGSDNIGYTASKIYAYPWFNKPLITLFHSSSSVNDFMKDCNAGLSLMFDIDSEKEIINKIVDYIISSINLEYKSNVNWNKFEKYTAQYQVKNQVELFNNVLIDARR